MSAGSRHKRDRLVRELQARGIPDTAVLEAMRAIPREWFVEEALAAEAYADAALPIGDNQTISQPRIVARMSELLEPDGRGRALEIGTGSGYQAAVLSKLFELVHLKIFDGGYGWSEFAPYRAIAITAAVPAIPEPLIEQLDDGGILVAPVARAGEAAEQTLVRVVRRSGEIVREEHGPCRFVPPVGRFGLEST